MDSIQIKCDYCGKEINCPAEEKDLPKHACYNCFQKLESELSDKELDQIQVDIPPEQMTMILTEELVTEVFPTVWDEKKEELKELSKKEMAQFMFAAGAQAMGQRITYPEDEEESKD